MMCALPDNRKANEEFDRHLRYFARAIGPIATWRHSCWYQRSCSSNWVGNWLLSSHHEDLLQSAFFVAVSVVDLDIDVFFLSGIFKCLFLSLYVMSDLPIHMDFCVLILMRRCVFSVPFNGFPFTNHWSKYQISKMIFSGWLQGFKASKTDPWIPGWCSVTLLLRVPILCKWWLILIHIHYHSLLPSRTFDPTWISDSWVYRVVSSQLILFSSQIWSFFAVASQINWAYLLWSFSRGTSSTVEEVFRTVQLFEIAMKAGRLIDGFTHWHQPLVLTFDTLSMVFFGWPC